MNRTTLLTALGGVLLAAALSGVGFVLAQNGTPAGENGASSANVPVAPPEPKNVPAKPKPAPNAADQELEEKLAKLERYRSHLQAEIDVAEKAIELQERASGAAGNSDPMQAFRIRYLETEKLLTAINREIDRLSAEIKVLKSRLKEAPVNAQNDAALLAQLVAENPQVKAAQQRLNKLRETLEIMRKNVPDPDNPSIHELKASLRESQQDLIAAEKLAIGLATEELRARSLADIQKRIPELQLQVDIKVEEREGIRRERDAVKKVIENTTGSGRSSEDLRKAIEPQREMLAKLNRQALLLRTQREGITLTDHSTNDTKLDAILKELAELRKEVQELKRMPR